MFTCGPKSIFFCSPVIFNIIQDTRQQHHNNLYSRKTNRGALQWSTLQRLQHSNIWSSQIRYTRMKYSRSQLTQRSGSVNLQNSSSRHSNLFSTNVPSKYIKHLQHISQHAENSSWRRITSTGKHYYGTPGYHKISKISQQILTIFTQYTGKIHPSVNINHKHFTTFTLHYLISTINTSR